MRELFADNRQIPLPVDGGVLWTLMSKVEGTMLMILKVVDQKIGQLRLHLKWSWVCLLKKNGSQEGMGTNPMCMLLIIMALPCELRHWEDFEPYVACEMSCGMGQALYLITSVLNSPVCWLILLIVLVWFRTTYLDSFISSFIPSLFEDIDIWTSHQHRLIWFESVRIIR